VRCSFFNTDGVKDRGTAKTSAVVWMQIQPCTRGVTAHHSVEDQLCVPAMQIDGDSYRMRAHRARIETLRKGVTPTNRG
jgi:hypothetical protein